MCFMSCFKNWQALTPQKFLTGAAHLAQLSFDYPDSSSPSEEHQAGDRGGPGLGAHRGNVG